MVFRGGVCWCGRALHDGVEGHRGGGEDEGDVEDFGGHAGRFVSIRVHCFFFFVFMQASVVLAD